MRRRRDLRRTSAPCLVSSLWVVTTPSLYPCCALSTVPTVPCLSFTLIVILIPVSQLVYKGGSRKTYILQGAPRSLAVLLRKLPASTTAPTSTMPLRRACCATTPTSTLVSERRSADPVTTRTTDTAASRSWRLAKLTRLARMASLRRLLTASAQRTPSTFLWISTLLTLLVSDEMCETYKRILAHRGA